MAPSLTLYGDPFSANTRIVTIVLEMLELKYEFRSIDVMHGDHLSSNFQKASKRIKLKFRFKGKGWPLRIDQFFICHTIWTIRFSFC